HMESRILELSKSFSAILLTGPRQAGKTTMLRSLAEIRSFLGGKGTLFCDIAIVGLEKKRSSRKKS
ncbi:MAG: hypothetical protein J5803_04920, partial [Desulfovibrio sp.]|nr:hypothetical protein [Desulfovibrio sp.]